MSQSNVSASNYSNEWSCTVCTYSNAKSRTRCEMCQTDKPSPAAAPSSTKPVEQSKPAENKSDGGSSSDSKQSGKMSIFVAEFSQFTFGGESACPFGTLELGMRLLKGELDPTKERKDQMPVFKDALQRAVTQYQAYFKGRQAGHASPHEIMNEQASMFKDIELQTFDVSAGMPAQFKAVESKLVFPEVFLGMGEIQLQAQSDSDMLALLRGFAKTDCFLSVVNCGYVFGVQCRKDGSYVVFDTHSKNFSQYGDKNSGAFMVLHPTVESASSMVLDFVMSSRKEILKHAEGVHQTEAANKMEIGAFILKKK